jgi:predicted MPP superfamily phosphohydrolase
VAPRRDERVVKLAWASDIHLDSAESPVREAFARDLRDSGAEMLLLTGDIDDGLEVLDSLRWLHEATGLPIRFVLGNHDYWGRRIDELRTELRALPGEGVRWLPAAGPVDLTDRVQLVGCDGWGDAVNGNLDDTELFLADYLVILDLKESLGGGDGNPLDAWHEDRSGLLEHLRFRGRIEAEILADLLRRTDPGRDILLGTHVPPFVEACRHRGVSSPQGWPGFSCGSTGAVLREFARVNPDRKLTVLCGHTHEAWEGYVEGVGVRVAGARYGSPAFHLLDV